MAFQMQSEDTNHDIFYFDQETREYISTQTQRLIKSGEGIPGYSTVDELPAMTANQVAVRNGDDFEGTAWIVTDDHRDDTAYAKDITTHQDFIIDNLEPLTSDYTLIERTGDNYTFNETTQSWDLDAAKVAAALVLSKNEKVSEFRVLCGQKIEAPFTSSALGSSNGYRCNRDDQERMRRASVSASGGKIWIGESFTQHNQAQATNVYNDAMSHVDLITDEYAGKYDDIQNASDQAELDLITWV